MVNEKRFTQRHTNNSSWLDAASIHYSPSSPLKLFLFMKPLNRIERTHAFLRFLLLFLITVGVIVAVVFFSIEVPWKENDQLRQRMTRIKEEADAAEAFNTTVRETVDELNKFETRQDQPPLFIRQQVNVFIEKLNRQLKGLPNGENSVNALIVQSLNALNQAKYRLATKPE